MKFKVYDQHNNRYLSDEELEGKYYSIDGKRDKDYPEMFADIQRFEVNLLTGKIQTDHDNACSDEDCCTPCEMFADDDNFIVEIDGNVRDN